MNRNELLGMVRFTLELTKNQELDARAKAIVDGIELLMNREPAPRTELPPLPRSQEGSVVAASTEDLEREARRSQPPERQPESSPAAAGDEGRLIILPGEEIVTPKRKPEVPDPIDIPTLISHLERYTPSSISIDVKLNENPVRITGIRNIISSPGVGCVKLLYTPNGAGESNTAMETFNCANGLPDVAAAMNRLREMARRLWGPPGEIRVFAPQLRDALRHTEQDPHVEV